MKKTPFAFGEFWKHETFFVGVIAFVFACALTQGLPLWDDDYHQWLKQAGSGFFSLLGQILLPFTNQPETWGYSDRPLLVMVYKVLHGVMGFWGTGFFFFKSIGLGILCASVWHWLRAREGLDRLSAALVVGLFMVCANVTASMVMLSDFTVFSQAALIGILAWSLRQMNSPARSDDWRDWLRFHGFFFLSVYFATKLKGDVRLAPLILLAWLGIYRKAWLKVHALPFALTFMASLPWSKDFFRKLPPFVPGATGYSGWTFSPFSMSRSFEFLFTDLFRWNMPSLSVLGAIGIVVVAAFAVYAGWRGSRDKLVAPNPETGFLLVWLGVSILACGSIGRQNPVYQLRYTLIPLVPAILLLGRFLAMAVQDFSRSQLAFNGMKFAWFRPLLCTVFAVQCLLHLNWSYLHRRDMGRARVATDNTFHAIDANFSGSTFAQLPGFLPYAYRATASNAFQNRKILNNISEFYAMPIGTIAAGWTPILASDIAIVQVVSSCNRSLFDLIAPCAPAESMFIMKLVGNSTEVIEAEQLSSQGKFAEARTLLETFNQRQPGSHGVMFSLSVLNYRLQDFSKMEQLYEEFGRYHPANTSILYNWGLAKQGLKKFDESYRLLEQAYSMMPNDYGVGFNLAASYYGGGKKTRALAMLGNLMKLYPNDGTMKAVYADWSKK